MDWHGDDPSVCICQNSELYTKKGNFTKLKNKQTNKPQLYTT